MKPSLPTVLEIGGAVALVVGITVIWWPAGLIVGGVLTIALAQGVNR